MSSILFLTWYHSYEDRPRADRREGPLRVPLLTTRSGPASSSDCLPNLGPFSYCLVDRDSTSATSPSVAAPAVTALDAAFRCGHNNKGLFVGAAGLLTLNGGPLSNLCPLLPSSPTCAGGILYYCLSCRSKVDSKNPLCLDATLRPLPDQSSPQQLLVHTAASLWLLPSLSTPSFVASPSTVAGPNSPTTRPPHAFTRTSPTSASATLPWWPSYSIRPNCYRRSDNHHQSSLLW